MFRVCLSSLRLTSLRVFFLDTLTLSHHIKVESLSEFLENVFSLGLELLSQCWIFVEPGVSFSTVLDKMINSQPMNHSVNFN